MDLDEHIKQETLAFIYGTEEKRKFLTETMFPYCAPLLPKKSVIGYYKKYATRNMAYTKALNIMISVLTSHKRWLSKLCKFYGTTSILKLGQELLVAYTFYIVQNSKRISHVNIFTQNCSIVFCKYNYFALINNYYFNHGEFNPIQ